MVVLCNHYRCCGIAYTAYYFQRLEPNAAALITTLAVFLAVEFFCLSIVLHNYVELQNEELIIVFGFIKKKIPYGDILSISPTRDASSSLAASLDRIEIKYKNIAQMNVHLKRQNGVV